MVKAIDTSSGESVIIFWNYNISKLENHLKAAEALYLKLKINVSNIYYSENKKYKGYDYCKLVDMTDFILIF